MHDSPLRVRWGVISMAPALGNRRTDVDGVGLLWTPSGWSTRTLARNGHVGSLEDGERQAGPTAQASSPTRRLLRPILMPASL